MPPEDGDHTPIATANAIGRMGERLAALEARTDARIGQLMADAARIRDNLHQAMETMQQFIASVSADKAVMTQHIADCAKRGARLEKLVWIIIAGVLGLVFMWLRQHILGEV